MAVEMYHNPRCSMSRRTLELLQKQGIEPKLRLYLEQHPSQQEIKTLLSKLGITATDLLRTKEDVYKKLVSKHGKPSNQIAVQWMATYPILIERPIVIKGDRARLGRPPEKVLEILK